MEAGACDVAEVLVDDGGGLPLAVYLVGGSIVVFVEVLDGRGDELVLVIVCHEGLDFLGGEPPLLLVAHNEVVGLVVKGFVVGLVARIDGSRELDADEAAVASGVAQDAGLVGGSDEGGVALELLDMLAIGALDLDAG